MPKKKSKRRKPKVIRTPYGDIPVEDGGLF